MFRFRFLIGMFSLLESMVLIGVGLILMFLVVELSLWVRLNSLISVWLVEVIVLCGVIVDLVLIFMIRWLKLVCLLVWVVLIW